MRHTFLVTTLLALTLSWGCEESGTQHSNAGSFSMGPSGGKLVIGDGAEVSVPPGALQGSVVVGLENLGPSAYSTPTLIPVGDFYRLGPTGQQFAAPVTVILPFSSGLVGGNAASVRVFLSSDEGATFAPLPLLSTSKKTVVGGQTTHFSIAVPALPLDQFTANNPTEGGEEGGGPGTPTYPPHNGCATQTTPGCGGCVCEESVCSVSPSCCSTSWSASCAQLCAEIGGHCPVAGEEGGGESPSEEGGEGQAEEGGEGEGGGTPNSCAGYCDKQAPSGCWCDSACITTGDCCENVCDLCDYCEGGCGDGQCGSGETCVSCEADCGACADVCGDGQCGNSETCASCALDCCDPYCGDQECNGAENCLNCAGDCGACTSANSCEGICGSNEQLEEGCFCDESCLTYDDCCPDACSLCGYCP